MPLPPVRATTVQPLRYLGEYVLVQHYYWAGDTQRSLHDDYSVLDIAGNLRARDRAAVLRKHSVTTPLFTTCGERNSDLGALTFFPALSLGNRGTLLMSTGKTF